MSLLENKSHSLNLGGTLFSLEKPIVMGILNVTPDSFFDGGKYTSDKAILAQTEKMLSEGATIIDVGGASSKPKTVEISESEETKRAITTIKLLIKTFPTIKISIDTYRSGVAKQAIEFGAVMINDISGGQLDEKMFETVASLKVPYVLMHMKGNPKSMTELTQYNDLLIDIMRYFHIKVQSLKALGVKDIILDLGFGFAKNIDQNFDLLKKLTYFNELNLPMLVGVSRKSMIYKQLGIKPEDSLNGTTALNTMALMNGAKILRVHDVKEALETVRLFSKTYLES